MYGLDKIYKIHRYSGIADRKLDPSRVNYKSGLNISLFPKRHFDHGELFKVEWFSDELMTDLILQVDINYLRDSMGFAIQRVTTRSWLKEDGEIGHTKVTKKIYSYLEQIVEGKTRRGNIINGMQMPVIGFMQATITDKTQEEIILMGREFLALHKPEFNNFIDDSNRTIVDTITSATDYWLDNVTAYGFTIREYILNELNIGGIS